MTDIKILVIKDILPVTGIDYLSVSPPSVQLRGDKFLQATEVFINDLPSPEFMIVSNQRILAQIPKGQETSVIRKVSVLAEQPSKDRSSILHFEVGTSFKGLKGIERMVQFFVKILLQTPGSDRFRPTIGGDLLSVIGESVTGGGNNSGVSAAVMNSVSRTKDQIVSLQSHATGTPSDERLLSAVVQAVGFDPNTTTLATKVALTAMSGRAAVANLTF